MFSHIQRYLAPPAPTTRAGSWLWTPLLITLGSLRKRESWIYREIANIYIHKDALFPRNLLFRRADLQVNTTTGAGVRVGVVVSAAQILHRTSRRVKMDFYHQMNMCQTSLKKKKACWVFCLFVFF